MKKAALIIVALSLAAQFALSRLDSRPWWETVLWMAGSVLLAFPARWLAHRYLAWRESQRLRRLWRRIEAEVLAGEPPARQDHVVPDEPWPRR